MDAEGKPDHSVPVDYANEARYFVESRLLQRDVQIVLESVNNTNFVGSILFPKGNIAEALLREGFAKCVDWSMAFMRTGIFYSIIFVNREEENAIKPFDITSKNPRIISTKSTFSICQRKCLENRLMQDQPRI